MAPSRAEENFRHTDVDLERSGQTTATRRADFSPLSAQAKPQSDVTAVRGRALQRAPISVAGADATGRCNLRLLSTSRLLVNRRFVVALPRGASGCRQQDAAAAFWKPPTGATEFPPFASRNGSPQHPHPARLQLRQQHLGISEAEIAPNFFQAHPLAEESAVSSSASDEKGPPYRSASSSSCRRNGPLCPKALTACEKKSAQVPASGAPRSLRFCHL